nr:hypothetical protein CFP56_37319 [Quercus suber]
MPLACSKARLASRVSRRPEPAVVELPPSPRLQYVQSDVAGATGRGSYVGRGQLETGCLRLRSNVHKQATGCPAKDRCSSLQRAVKVIRT